MSPEDAATLTALRSSFAWHADALRQITEWMLDLATKRPVSPRLRQAALTVTHALDIVRMSEPDLRP